jgi:hypothetical protein
VADKRTRTKRGETVRIDVTSDADVRNWCERLGLGREQLEAAIREVGPNTNDIIAFLQESADGKKR